MVGFARRRLGAAEGTSPIVMQSPAWAPAPNDGSFLDLHEYLQVVKRRWKLVFVITAIAVGLAVAWTATRTPVYTATADVLVEPPLGVLATSGTTPTLNIDNEREIMQSLPVATVAAPQIDMQVSPRDLLSHLEVTIPKDADVLEVAFSHTNPATAAQGAQAFADAYLSYKTVETQTLLDDRTEAINANISELRVAGGSQTAINNLEQEVAQLAGTAVDPGEVLVPAEPPTKPSSPSWVLNVGLALMLGLFVGLVAAFVRERTDDRLRGRGDLEETFGVPVMTMIPEVPSWRNRAQPYVVTLDAPRSPAAEAYRTLRTSILVTAAERGVKTLMVVSAMASEGKTTTAANLAVVLAQADKRVVLISADLRRPRLHEFFGLAPTERGLSEVLEGKRRAWEALRSGKVNNLWIMSSGEISDQPTELLQSEAMRQLLADQREVVDFILLDCPPVLAVADALVLAPMVDAVLFVADAKGTPRGAVIQARAQLDQVGARMLGTVLNDVEGGTAGYAYYGQYVYEPDAAGSSNGKASVWEHIRGDRSRS
jgi:succinoglycan biosynthesis transport protein ExoP